MLVQQPSDFNLRLDRHPSLRAVLRTDEGLHVADRIALAIRLRLRFLLVLLGFRLGSVAKSQLVQQLLQVHKLFA